MSRIHRLLPLAAVAVINTAAIASGVTFTLVSTDAPGIGFNDPSPRAPVGGNAGTPWASNGASRSSTPRTCGGRACTARSRSASPPASRL
jgi:hypothetical protein